MASIINPEDYSIVWLCPLPIETTAALFMFDEHHEGVINRQHGQTVEYHFGRIGRHNVAIASFPSGEVGIGKAGAMAEAVIRDFKNLELGLLVGIGAAIPSQNRDIRLGDVAVADPVGHYPGVVAYDMVKVVPGEELQKQWMDATHPLWRSVISKIRARTTVRGDTFHQHLKVFDKPEAKIFQRPYDPPPLHPAFGHRRETDGPIVHYGTMLSGNKVIRATEFRDQLKTKYGDPVALEMEAAGVMTSLPVAVVRGISDYADPLKNDEWHARAAAVAAGYAKEMLLQLSPKLPASKTCESEAKMLLRGQLPKSWDFYGREDHLKTIAMHLDRGRQKPFEKSVLIISGLSGAGKSQLASAYAKSQLAADSGREIFWINGRNRKTFETSIVQFCRDPRKSLVSTQTQVTEDTDRQSAEIVESFLQELNRPGNTGWLMVVDDLTLWSQDGHSTESTDLNCYLDKIQQGSLLITTNRQNWLTNHENVLSVKGLDDTSAVSLLNSKLHNHSIRDAELHELAQMLHGLPLSLRLAITYICKRGIRVIDYINMWKERKLDDSLSLIEPSLVQTLTLCFEDLQLRDANAANLLTLFGFLDPKNFSFDLCQNAESPNLPGWLSAVGNDRNQFNKAVEALLDLSFVQLNNDETEVTTYSIHPAVHAFARNRAGGSKGDYISWAVSLIADNVPRSLDKSYWKKAQTLASHADQCMVYIHAGKFQPQNLERIGALFRLLGRYEDASQLYKAVLKSLLPHRDAFLETIAQVLNDLGLVYYGQRKFELAVKTFRDSIGAYSRLPEPVQNGSADTLMCIIFNHGNAYRMMQDLNAAVAAFNHVYDFSNQQKGNSGGSLPCWIEILVSRVLNALGEISLERKETRSAMLMLQSALSTQNRYLDNIHPIVLSTKMNLGRAYTDLESYSEACELLRDVTQKYIEQWGAGHHAAVTAADQLARACMGYGQMMGEPGHSGNMGDEALGEAERLWVENLSFYGEKYGVNSEDALRTKANLALLQSVRGNLVTARRNMLQVFQRSTIPAQKVKAQCDLALICQQMGDLDVAETNFRQAVEASKFLIEPNRTRELFRSMFHQAQLYSSLGKRDNYLRILRDLNMLQPAEYNEWRERACSEIALVDKVSSQNSSNPQGTSQDRLPLEQRSRKRKWQMD